MFAILVVDIKSTHIGMIDRQVGALFKGDAEEFVHGKENAILEYAVELKIGTHFRLVNIVFGLPHFFSIIVPVPWFYFIFDTILFHHCFDGCFFLVGIFDDGGNQVGEHIKCIFGRLGRLGVQLIGGMVFVAQQLGTFGAQLHNF